MENNNTETTVLRHQSEETKRKISESLSGRTLTKAHRRKISLSKKGIRLTEETRKRMSTAKQSMTDDTKQKMSIAKTGSNHPLYGLKGPNNPKFGKTYPRKTPK